MRKLSEFAIAASLTLLAACQKNFSTLADPEDNGKPLQVRLEMDGSTVVSEIGCSAFDTRGQKCYVFADKLVYKNEKQEKKTRPLRIHWFRDTDHSETFMADSQGKYLCSYAKLFQKGGDDSDSESNEKANCKVVTLCGQYPGESKGSDPGDFEAPYKKKFCHYSYMVGDSDPEIIIEDGTMSH